VAKTPRGSRTLKGLDRIYAEEGLPARREELPHGEKRMLQQSGCRKIADSLAADQVVPRKKSTASG